jgi:type II secretory pathway component PulL
VIEVAVGFVPVLGDMFDIAWRANRRNYALLTGSIYEPRKYTRQSWLFLAGLCVILLVLVAVPTLLVAWLSVHLFAGIFGMDIHLAPKGR